MVNFLSKIFGNKSQRDLKEVMPFVNETKAVYETIKTLSNDELRGKTIAFKAEIRNAVDKEETELQELRTRIENEYDMAVEEKENIYKRIELLEKTSYEKTQTVLNKILPEAFAVVKETARRFAENDEVEVTATDRDRDLSAVRDSVTIRGDKAYYKNTWSAGGNTIKWDMVHYDVQLIGGIVLHNGKIAEMATGEGKTLVGTLPVYLNALPGKGVHVVTVNDYLAKRDSEWMGMLFEFHGLKVDCIDKYEPHSEERKNAYLADITYGTNNEFGFDYLRDNMSRNPDELVQREHNFAIVDEVDSVLIDDARTPLIISGPTPKGDDQEFDRFKPIIEKIYNAQRTLVTQILADAKRLLTSGNADDEKKGGELLLRAHRGLPKNKALIKFLSEQGMKAVLLKTENFYMQEQNKHMHIIDDELYFVIDEKQHTIDLTDKGINFLGSLGENPKFYQLPDVGSQIAELEKEDLSQDEKLKRKDEILKEFSIQSDRVHTVNQLLKAYTLFEKDVEYVVIDNKVKIVDEQTGRIMEGRRYSDGLHQAIEAKEAVKVEAATQTYATITLQNYFRMYKKLSGMTGTAETEAGEFWNIYKLDVVVIPTNRPVVRQDMEDMVFKTKREKYTAVINEIERLRNEGRPVLVGTTSVEVSELLSKMLTMRKIKHNVLNAKLHKKEADIVAEAGYAGTVTIATNMAGRGTDIMLGGNAEYLAKAALRHDGFSEEMITEATGFADTTDPDIINARETYKAYYNQFKAEIAPEAEAVRNAGGLAIIGTERHDSRRIDNQLRGRAGRQGDAGNTQFFVSLEDDLMRLFGGERISVMMDTLKVDENMPLESGMLSKSIESAQRKKEGMNFAIRKNVLQYDDVMNKQRELIYGQRNKVLEGEDIKDTVRKMVDETIDIYTDIYLADPICDNWDIGGLKEYFYGWVIMPDDVDFTTDKIMALQKEEVAELLKEAE